MNIALEQTEEYVNGQLKNKYGDAFIRGNNGMHPPFHFYMDPITKTPVFGVRYKKKFQAQLNMTRPGPILSWRLIMK